MKVSEALEVLGLEVGAADDEVEDAWHAALIVSYPGLFEEGTTEHRKAVAKTAQIDEAYNLLTGSQDPSKPPPHLTDTKPLRDPDAHPRKKCIKCGEFKGLDEFRDPSLKTGVGHICTSCKERRRSSVGKTPAHQTPAHQGSGDDRSWLAGIAVVGVVLVVIAIANVGGGGGANVGGGGGANVGGGGGGGGGNGETVSRPLLPDGWTTRPIEGGFQAHGKSDDDEFAIGVQVSEGSKGVWLVSGKGEILAQPPSRVVAEFSGGGEPLYVSVGSEGYLDIAGTGGLEAFLRNLSKASELRLTLAAGTQRFDLTGSSSALQEIGAVTPPAPPPRTAQLSVGVEEGWGTVYLDGVQYGETPLGPLSIDPGPHLLLIQTPDGKEAGGAFTFGPGEHKRVVLRDGSLTEIGGASSDSRQATPSTSSSRPATPPTQTRQTTTASPTTGGSRSNVSSSASSGGLGAAPRLAGLSAEMQRLVRSGCSSEERAADYSISSRNRYHTCLTAEIRKAGTVRSAPRLAGLSAEMQRLVRSGCSSEERAKDYSISSRNRYHTCLTEEIRKARGGT